MCHLASALDAERARGAVAPDLKRAGTIGSRGEGTGADCVGTNTAGLRTNSNQVVGGNCSAGLNHAADAVLPDEELGSVGAGSQLDSSVGSHAHQAGSAGPADEQVVVRFDRRRVRRTDAITDIYFASSAGIANGCLAELGTCKPAARTQHATVEVVSSLRPSARADGEKLERSRCVAADDDAGCLIENADAPLADAQPSLRRQRAGAVPIHRAREAALAKGEVAGACAAAQSEIRRAADGNGAVAVAA